MLHRERIKTVNK